MIVAISSKCANAALPPTGSRARALSRWAARFLFVVALPLLLGSCSGIFDLRPTGHITDLTFRFYKTAEDKNPSRFPIDMLVVRKRSGSEWKVVWALTGRRRLDAVRFGHEYRGLHTEAGPEPLVRGGKYSVIAHSDGLSASAEFTVDANGYVVVPPPRI